MKPQWIIEKKRDKEALSKEEIDNFIQAYTTGEIPDYQMSALAMAICLNGMSFEEISMLTQAMMESGDIVDTSFIDKPKVDKHSTGGIGDKVSLILAPLIASCGIAVPMISGRGLGITGGTLDKLESIPGYRTDLREDEFVHITGTCGCSIAGQTAQIAPADRKLYALRDVTGTVPSLPLIVASIMSKKLAEGIDSLVLDVKWGTGAFMKSQKQAQDLAFTLVEVGRKMGKGTAAIISDMNQPLGHTAGNALEVKESIECLQGDGEDELVEITMALGAQMLILAGVTNDEIQALQHLQAKLGSGEALEVFKTMVEMHGGDPSVVDDPTQLPEASIQRPFAATQGGFMSEVDAEKIGRACIALGAGRTKTDDEVDPAVGVADIVKVGEMVDEGQLVCTVHANDETKYEEAMGFIREAFAYADEPPLQSGLIVDTIPAGV